jgi:hypothetical protein
VFAELTRPSRTTDHDLRHSVSCNAEAAEADRAEWVPLAEVPKLVLAGQVPDGRL